MTDLDPELRRLLAPLHEPSEGARDDAQLSADAEARVLASMQRHVRAAPALRTRARRLRQLYVAAPLTLALAASALLMLRPASDSEVVRVASSGEGVPSWTPLRENERPLHGQDELVGDGELTVPAHATAELTTPLGVWMEAREQTRLSLHSKKKHGQDDVMLERGSVRCRVPKLGQGKAFVVATARARVVVHGTDFSVALGTAAARADQGPCVRVSEGLVEVQHAQGPATWLGPGSSWGCAASEPVKLAAPTEAPEEIAAPVTKSADTQVVPTRVARASHGRVARSHERKRLARTKVVAPSESTLERENRLLADALKAERLGEDARAATLFARLLESYPASPLAPEAKAGLVRTRSRP